MLVIEETWKDGYFSDWLNDNKSADGEGMRK